jgi:LEA14-like dessication related protein
MKSMRTSLLILALSTLIISCKDAQKPVFENVENVKLGKMGLAETTLSADIRFNNLNTFGMRVKKIDCDLYVDSSFMGHFSSTAPVKIRPKQSFLLPLSGQAQTLRLMEQSRKGMAGQRSLIRVEGKARVGRSGFYKTIPFVYDDTLVLSELLK